MKKYLLILIVFVGLFLFTTTTDARAQNPVTEFLKKIQKVLIINEEEQPIPIKITNLPTSTPLPEPTPMDVDKWIDVCFHVPNGSLRVMLGGTCHPDVHWRIPVKCVEGKPCQPDNPDDPFYQ